MKRFKGLFTSLLFILSSCGYRFETASTSLNTRQGARTVTVPYVSGDLEGRFTSQLIYTLSSMGKWRFVHENGDFILRVSIVNQRSEEVGYNRAFQNGTFIKELVPNENRLSALALVELIDSSTQKTVLGPQYISSSVVYDYDPNFNTQNLVRFSLAQYNFQEVAARSARIPLERRLAVAIVDYLNYGW